MTRSLPSVNPPDTQVLRFAGSGRQGALGEQDQGKLNGAVFFFFFGTNYNRVLVCRCSLRMISKADGGSATRD